MPAKKKGGAGGKAKKKGKKRSAKADSAASENAMVKLKSFLMTYSANCLGSFPSSRIMRACRDAVEDDKTLTTFILDSESDIVRRGRVRVGNFRTKSASMYATTAPSTSLDPRSRVAPPGSVQLQPLIATLKVLSYDYMHNLHVWGIQLSDDDVVSLALFLESSNSVNLKTLELRDTHLSSWSIRRLAKSLVQVGVISLNLDYNRIYPDALLQLCEMLQLNMLVRTLSLNYCHLDPACGEILGHMASISQIRNLSVVGNSIQCQGLMELMKPLVSIHESEAVTSTASGEHSEAVVTAVSMVGVSPPHTPTIEISEDGEQEKQEELEDSSEGRESPKLPILPLIPALAKLDIRDNSIDSHSIHEDEKVLTFELIVCMRIVKRLIINSPVLEEINLDHNLIGDGGARELLQGLQQRKEAGLAPIKLTITSIQISADTFRKLIKLGSPPKKKKGKRKRKKK